MLWSWRAAGWERSPDSPAVGPPGAYAAFEKLSEADKTKALDMLRRQQVAIVRPRDLEPFTLVLSPKGA